MWGVWGEVCCHLVPEEPHASTHGRKTLPLQTLWHELFCGRRSVLPHQEEACRGWGGLNGFSNYYIRLLWGNQHDNIMQILHLQVKCTAVSTAQPHSHSPSNWHVTSARTPETNRMSAGNVGKASNKPMDYPSISRTFTVSTSTWVTWYISLSNKHKLNYFSVPLDITEPHDCQKCRVSFSSLDELRQHIQEVHPKELHQCPECSKIFNSEANLEKHMNVHDGNKPYSCKMCKKSYQARTVNLICWL